MKGSRERAEALYRRAIRLYPADFRRRFGEEMTRTFRDGAGDAVRRGGRRALAAYTLRCVTDALVEGPRERLGAWARGLGDGFARDLRDAWRGLRRRPSLSVVAVGILLLGAGANGAIFSVVNGVLLRPFDFPAAGELVVIQDRSLDGGRPFRTTGGAYLTWRRESRSLEEVGLLGGYTLNLTEEGMDPERVVGSAVSASYFDVLGIRPALGRTFLPAETRGGARVVVLSDALWRGRYGADPAIVGRTLTADGEAWQVVGVMPPVAFPSSLGDLTLDPADARRIWVPLDFDSEWVSGYRSHVFVAVGRLAEGATPRSAGEEIAALTDGIRGTHPELYGRLGSDLRPFGEVVLGDARRDLWILLGGVALVLLVASANLANLLLARAVDRGGEWAVRAALGAGAARLVRLGVVEALLLGVVGGGSGLAAAWWGQEALVALLPQDLPRRSGVRVDGAVMAFTLLVASGAALAAALVPALRAARPDVAAALRASGRGGGAGLGGRLTRGLLVGQIALACALLSGAGLLVRSVQELQGTELGADVTGTMVAELVFPTGRYPTREAMVDVLRRVEEEVGAAVGVSGAAVAYDTPISGSWTESFDVVGRPPPPAGERPGAWFRPVSPGYFDRMGIRLVRGRDFTAADDADAPGVAVVNRAFAREHFPGEEVLGRRLRMTTVRGTWGDGPDEWEIVGVVDDVRFLGARRAAPDAFYLSLRQAPVPFVHLMARTEGEAALLEGGVREAMRRVDPLVPLSSVTTLDDARGLLTARDRLNAVLLLAFGALALAVAGAGVYGVASHAVARRVPEMGVRLALGARPATVRALLLGEILRTTGVGVLAGGVAALLVGRLLSGLLFGVRPWDPAVLGAVLTTLFATAVVAGWLPARRAATTDPSTALRGE